MNEQPENWGYGCTPDERGWFARLRSWLLEVWDDVKEML